MAWVVGVDNEFITVSCDPETGIVQHVMHGFVVSSVFREALDTGLTLMEAHAATKWLSDDRKCGALSSDALEWAAHDWHPRALSAGLKSWALVFPEAVVGKMRSRRVVENAQRMGLTAQAFDDPMAARRWLKQTADSDG